MDSGVQSTRDKIEASTRKFDEQINRLSKEITVRCLIANRLALMSFYLVTSEVMASYISSFSRGFKSGDF